jgi:hypothetical protein
MEQVMVDKEQIKSDMEVYTLAYLRGRDAHQKRVLTFINDNHTQCSLQHSKGYVCHPCLGAEYWYMAIKKELERRTNES